MQTKLHIPYRRPLPTTTSNIFDHGCASRVSRQLSIFGISESGMGPILISSCEDLPGLWNKLEAGFRSVLQNCRISQRSYNYDITGGAIRRYGSDEWGDPKGRFKSIDIKC